MAERQQALQAVEAAQDSLDLIGEGDWTPQDLHCARLIRHVMALAASLQEAERQGWADLERKTSLLEDLKDTQARLQAAEEALREIHEYNCGCDTPGRLDFCVAQPIVLFAALDSLAAAASVPANKETPDAT